MALRGEPEVTADLNVGFVPELIRQEEIGDRTVVMADILRASTTMITALVNGASGIFPRADIAESTRLAQDLGESTILGGERNGTKIDGFDAGNSPLEYGADFVRNRNIVLCTTNGTFTLDLCRNAENVLIGSFVNLSAICRELANCRKVCVACAGTDRRVSDEDVLFAGALVDRLNTEYESITMDDSARIAVARWRTVYQQIESNQTELWNVLAKSRGGEKLMRLGYIEDVRYCAQIDLFDIVPQLNLENWIVGIARP